jgi:hypothetical protein
MTTDTTETLRLHAVGWFRTIDDPSQTHEVRLIACSAIGWVLYFVQDDESLLADMLKIVRRAIERDDGSPMLLLFEAGPTIQRNANLAAAVMRLGEHALSRSNIYALARITIALGRRTDSLLRWGESPDPLRAPPHWIRALIADSPPDRLEGDVATPFAGGSTTRVTISTPCGIWSPTPRAGATWRVRDPKTAIRAAPMYPEPQASRGA